MDVRWKMAADRKKMAEARVKMAENRVRVAEDRLKVAEDKIKFAGEAANGRGAHLKDSVLELTNRSLNSVTSPIVLWPFMEATWRSHSPGQEGNTIVATWAFA